MDNLAQLLALSTESLWAGWIVFLRVGALAFALPGFGEQSVPARIRLAVAFAFTLIVAPAVAESVPAMPDDILAALPLFGTEIAAGLAFGLILRLFVNGLQVAGAIAAQSTSLSQIFGGTAGVDPLPAMGHVLLIGGLALAMLMGLHVRVATYLLAGYELVPVGVLIGADTAAAWGTAAVARVFALGFTLAAPFLIASLLYNVTLGIINRAMPQLMVSFVGAPAITAGGLLLLVLTAPTILELWFAALAEVLADPRAVTP